MGNWDIDPRIPYLYAEGWWLGQFDTSAALSLGKQASPQHAVSGRMCALPILPGHFGDEENKPLAPARMPGTETRFSGPPVRNLVRLPNPHEGQTYFLHPKLQLIQWYRNLLKPSSYFTDHQV
jgi:hypothetical protein